jgi:hypothetical protein
MALYLNEPNCLRSCLFILLRDCDYKDSRLARHPTGFRQSDMICSIAWDRLMQGQHHP